MRTAAKANNPAANDPTTRIAAAAAAAITRTSISAVQPRRTVISMPSSLAGKPAVPNPQNYSAESANYSASTLRRRLFANSGSNLSAFQQLFGD
jgi:hypothetical protein